MRRQGRESRCSSSTIFFMPAKFFPWIGALEFLTGKAAGIKINSSRRRYFHCCDLQPSGLNQPIFISIIQLRDQVLFQNLLLIAIIPGGILHSRTLWEWEFMQERKKI